MAGCLVDTGVGVADRTVATGVGVAGFVRSLGMATAVRDLESDQPQG